MAVNANLARYAKSVDLVPSAVVGKLCVAIFALFFVESFELVENLKLVNYRLAHFLCQISTTFDRLARVTTVPDTLCLTNIGEYPESTRILNFFF